MLVLLTTKNYTEVILAVKICLQRTLGNTTADSSAESSALRQRVLLSEDEGTKGYGGEK